MPRGPYRIVRLFVVSTSVFACVTVAEAETDFDIYEKRCGRCHGANPEKLAQTTLFRRGEKVVTRDQEIELRDFLDQHGRATTSEAHRIYSLLRRYLIAGGQ